MPAVCSARLPAISAHWSSYAAPRPGRPSLTVICFNLVEYFRSRRCLFCLQVCALGFTIKIVDADVAFTQGLGTFIMSAAQNYYYFLRRRRGAGDCWLRCCPWASRARWDCARRISSWPSPRMHRCVFIFLTHVSFCCRCAVVMSGSPRRSLTDRQVRRSLAAVRRLVPSGRPGGQRRGVPGVEHSHQCSIGHGGAAVRAGQAHGGGRGRRAAQDRQHGRARRIRSGERENRDTAGNGKLRGAGDWLEQQLALGAVRDHR